MARIFSFFEKKKGHRQTGSRVFGGLSAVVIYSTILLIGIVFSVSLVTLQVGQLSAGEQGFSTGGFWIRFSVTLLIIGVGGFQTFRTIWALTISPERKSAITISASNINLTHPADKQGEVLPNVPKHEYISGSPGVRLQHRLPVNSESLWQFVSIAFLCVVLLGIASSLMVLIVSGFLVGHSVNWVAVGMTPIFVTGAVWAVFRFFSQIFELAAIGPANIEISIHPLKPGATCEVYLYQAGLLKFRRIDLVLACFEHVTYQQGTDVRTETRRVLQKRILRVKNLKLDPAKPFEHRTELTIPEGAMHSFESPCNMVTWNLILTAVSNRWPRFSRRFPVIVHPTG